MRLFLRFLYTGTYDPDDADLFATVRLYAMADKFLVPPLKALALKRFRSAARYTWLENKDFPTSSTPSTASRKTGGCAARCASSSGPRYTGRT